jgi:hypothetical protein
MAFALVGASAGAEEWKPTDPATLATPYLALRGSAVSGNVTTTRQWGAGADLSVTAQWPVAGIYGVTVGPRVGGLAAWGSGVSRSEFDFGIEPNAWILNALNSGVSFDVVVPVSPADVPTHFRYGPHFAARFKRVGEQGALGGRFALLYDTQYKLQIHIGFQWEITGVP